MVRLGALACVLMACSTAPAAKPLPALPVASPDTDGDGIPNNKDNCPDLPGPVQHNGCPWCDTMVDWVICTWDGKPDPNCPKGTADDPDGDGIANDKDKCPSVHEDRDGFEDDDGCPEIDNDQDCVFDEQDKCPNAPGPKNTSGCPAPR